MLKTQQIPENRVSDDSNEWTTGASAGAGQKRKLSTTKSAPISKRMSASGSNSDIESDDGDGQYSDDPSSPEIAICRKPNEAEPPLKNVVDNNKPRRNNASSRYLTSYGHRMDAIRKVNVSLCM